VWRNTTPLIGRQRVHWIGTRAFPPSLENVGWPNFRSPGRMIIPWLSLFPSEDMIGPIEIFPECAARNEGTRLAVGCAFMTRSTRSLASCILSSSAKCMRDQQAKYPIPNTATTAISIAAQSLAMFSGLLSGSTRCFTDRDNTIPRFSVAIITRRKSASGAAGVLKCLGYKEARNERISWLCVVASIREPKRH
jgi:hypothetical protein